MMRIGIFLFLMLGLLEVSEATEKPFHRFFPAKVPYYSSGPQKADPLSIGHRVCRRHGWDGASHVTTAPYDRSKSRITGIYCKMESEMDGQQLQSLEEFLKGGHLDEKAPYVSDPAVEKALREKKEKAGAP